jgi:hypothetical protein
MAASHRDLRCQTFIITGMRVSRDETVLSMKTCGSPAFAEAILCHENCKAEEENAQG